MREVLLLITIILGQLAPNSYILEQVTKKLRLAPSTTTVKETPTGVVQIPANPTKIVLGDYTANAKAVYSVDVKSNKILTSKDSDSRLQVASLTKLMTAYIVLKEEDLNTIFTSKNLAPQEGDSTIGLINDDQMTVRGLLDGLLINSGSDAAQTLAVGNAGTIDAFVTKMNAYTVLLNLTNTHFANPVGWDDENNYSSAKDLTELSRILLRNETFAEIIKTKSKNVVTESGRVLPLTTTNQLLGNPGYVGVKTGYTYLAGECLVSLYENNGNQILTTIIGSPARFIETETIKGWILSHFSW